ncbi:hypothetical protein, partial [Mycoplasmopsis bovis]|uniref:hypothetical protein n=1 Tax=Mycoplasmopsis bovis TaxID=28903 RepID=UPI003D2E92A1
GWILGCEMLLFLISSCCVETWIEVASWITMTNHLECLGVGLEETQSDKNWFLRNAKVIIQVSLKTKNVTNKDKSRVSNLENK